MRRYDYKNHTLELKGSRGTVYTDDKLLFRGDGYIAIKFMLQWTDNAKEVRESAQRLVGFDHESSEGEERFVEIAKERRGEDGKNRKVRGAVVANQVRVGRFQTL